MTAAYYNEIDPDAAAILRQLISDDVIVPGDVDTRSITEVRPDDLRPYTQCHFFAGGGLWSVAARLAGWPDDRPLWTGSCPCQPFSVAGKGAGADDPRHLWPDFFRLIGARRPAVVVGEQVAGKAGYGWLDGVRADLASEGYAGRGVDIPSCAVDAPHIRQRLYWVALADAEGFGGRAGLREDDAFVDWSLAPNRDGCPACGGSGRIGPFFSGGMSSICANCQPVVDTSRIGRGERRPEHEFRGRRPALAGPDASGITLGDAFGPRLEGHAGHGDDQAGRAIEDRPVAAADGGHMGHAASGGRQQGFDAAAPARHGHIAAAAHGRNGSWWADHEWIACHDGKARRTQPGLPLLVDGLPGRVGLWRVAGNAINPVLAAEVLGAVMDVIDQPARPHEENPHPGASDERE